VSFLSQPITLQSLFGKDRKIDSITVDVVINESTSDVLTITKQPTQVGASITDHAYLEPTAFSMTILFQDNLTKSLSKIYQDLLDLQASRVPIDVTTPKRIYRDMLISTLSQVTDKHTENCLSISVSFQHIIIVSVSTVQVPRSRQRNAAVTGAIQNAGKKSALLTGVEAVLGR
jgi:hypothetical protein